MRLDLSLLTGGWGLFLGYYMKIFVLHGLTYPFYYFTFSKIDLKRICNGAGAAGSISGILVPNTLYGLSCVKAFNIHDVMYYYGGSKHDKLFADELMLKNMQAIIKKKCGFLSTLRYIRAYTYYMAVRMFGDSAYNFRG